MGPIVPLNNGMPMPEPVKQFTVSKTFPTGVRQPRSDFSF